MCRGIASFIVLWLLVGCDAFAEPVSGRNDDADLEPMLAPDEVRSDPPSDDLGVPLAPGAALPSDVGDVEDENEEDVIFDAPCGDFVTQPPEACDDGNNQDEDGCSADCSRVEQGYYCVGHSCMEICGDALRVGIERDSEHCDDGNPVTGDGCSERCLVERGFTCSIDEPQCRENVVCRDGVLQAGEECDPTVAGHDAHCAADCSLQDGYVCVQDQCEAVCSDGLIVDGEGCDDGNLQSADGCDERCRVEPGAVCFDEGACVFANCGDEVLEGPERCDDGTLLGGDGCSPTCSLEPDCSATVDACVSVCGDGWVPEAASREACDDGNLQLGDGCDDDCNIELGFECALTAVPREQIARAFGLDVVDGGALQAFTDAMSPAAAAPSADAAAGTVVLGFMRSSCSPICGDGIWSLGEVCDDGQANADAYEACATDCQSLPRCGDGRVNGPESCDNGRNQDGYRIRQDSCAVGCVYPPYCGDGVIDSRYGEQCDLGSLNDDDTYNGCNARCTFGPRCGDGVVDPQVNELGQAFETCDDGNRRNNDGCTLDCQRERRPIP